MKLSDAELEVNRLMKIHLPSIWTFKWDKAVRRFGSCCGATKTITLSKSLTLLNVADEVRSTMLHEIAHAMDFEIRGYSNHDKHWKKIAISLGDDGVRCYSKEVIQPQTKWIRSCDNCGSSHNVARLTQSACGKCCKEHNRCRYTSKYKWKHTLNPKYIK